MVEHNRTVRFDMLTFAAMADRHQALSQGARWEGDPSWAGPALVESWTMASLGKVKGTFSGSTAKNITSSVEAFVRDNGLTFSEAQFADRPRPTKAFLLVLATLGVVAGSAWGLSEGYWSPVIIGSLAPWVLFPKDLWPAFRQKGFLWGLRYWWGIAIVTIPLAWGMFWLLPLLLG